MNRKVNDQIKEILEQENLYKEEIYINDKHEYDYHKHEVSKNITVHTLYFSNSEEWNPDLRKQVSMQLVDNGNGIEIIGACNKKVMSYLEAEQLHILLRLASTHSVYEIAPPPVKTEF